MTTCSVPCTVTVNWALPHVCCYTASLLEVASLRCRGQLGRPALMRLALLFKGQSPEHLILAGPAAYTCCPASSRACGREAGLVALQWFSVEL